MHEKLQKIKKKKKLVLVFSNVFGFLASVIHLLPQYLNCSVTLLL